MDKARIHPRRPPVRLTLELRPDGGGIAGSLRDEFGGCHTFHGWLGLITLVEAARLTGQHAPGGA